MYHDYDTIHTVMTKKTTSTYEKFIASLSDVERKKFDDEYRELLLSELALLDFKVGLHSNSNVYFLVTFLKYCINAGKPF
jgi:hypothetical protein